MVRVCDAIMSTGKSQAAITYMNEHPDIKFIYITPYLDEAERIKKSCPKLHFIEPSDKLSQYGFRKSRHTAALIHDGRNITTTHQAFKSYTNEMLADVRRQGYRLIIDENIDVLENFSFNAGDLQMAIDAGYVEKVDNAYRLLKYDYQGSAFSDVFELLKSREIISLSEDQDELFYWTLPPDLITAFDEVTILTYLFAGQSLHHFLNIYQIPFTYIGVERGRDNGFRFVDSTNYVPEYVKELPHLIHILDNQRMNEIGDDYHALSMHWFNRSAERVQQLQKNIYNYYNNMSRQASADQRLWGTYNSAFSKLKGKGYSKSFLSFNTKATNKYRDRDHLVYAVNIFMNVNEKRFYKEFGIEADDDAYALSIMIQWIWRSAIRDGKEINIYIPSRRMRELLINWINSLNKGDQNVA